LLGINGPATLLGINGPATLLGINGPANLWRDIMTKKPTDFTPRKPVAPIYANIYELPEDAPDTAVLLAYNYRSDMEIRCLVDRDMVSALQDWYWSPKVYRQKYQTSAGERVSECVRVSTGVAKEDGSGMEIYTLQKVVVFLATGEWADKEILFLNGDVCDFRSRNLEIKRSKEQKRVRKAGK
jgi:hypothetical protein